jgi:hypothetical protein
MGISSIGTVSLEDTLIKNQMYSEVDHMLEDTLIKNQMYSEVDRMMIS